MRPADIAEDNRRKQHEMSALADSIQSLHQAIADMPDPAHKSRLSAALNTLTTVQEQCHKMHGASGQSGGSRESAEY